MFWDRVACVYEFYEKIYNGKVNRKLCREVAGMMAESDRVLECACGTGMITKAIAPYCKKVMATDFSAGMLKQAHKNCRKFSNVTIGTADITALEYEDESFDKVVAGNVIHLLEAPLKALAELERVCKKGGKIIIPTYVNHEKEGKADFFVRVWDRLGAGFKCWFSYRTYQQFFADAGFADVEFKLIHGKMPCAIAVITKQ